MECVLNLGPHGPPSRQQIQHLFDILGLDIKVRRGAHPTSALGSNDRAVTQAGADGVALDSRFAEAYDTGIRLAQNFIASPADAFDDLTSKAAHHGRDLIDADPEQKIDRGAQTI